MSEFRIIGVTCCFLFFLCMCLVLVSSDKGESAVESILPTCGVCFDRCANTSRVLCGRIAAISGAHNELTIVVGEHRSKQFWASSYTLRQPHSRDVSFTVCSKHLFPH